MPTFAVYFHKYGYILLTTRTLQKHVSSAILRINCPPLDQTTMKLGNENA